MELTEAAMDELYEALHSIERSLSKISDIEEKKYELMLQVVKTLSLNNQCPPKT